MEDTDYLVKKIDALEEQLSQYDDLAHNIYKLIHSDKLTRPENKPLLDDLNKLMGAWI